MKSNLVIAILMLSCILITACEEPNNYKSTGYVDDNILYLSCPYGGYVQKISTELGQVIKKNQSLIKLTGDLEENNVQMAKAKLRVARDNLSLAQDKNDYVSKYTVDALKHEVEAASANLDAAKWVSDTKEIHAPADGIIYNIYYQQGEYVPPMQPVMSVLIPDRMQVIFYVPEKNLNKIAINKTINVIVDQTNYKIPVIYVDNKAEFTPDSMFNEKQKNKVLFKVTAKLTQPLQAILKSGQPVEIDYE